MKNVIKNTTLASIFRVVFFSIIVLFLMGMSFTKGWDKGFRYGYFDAMADVVLGFQDPGEFLLNNKLRGN